MNRIYLAGPMTGYENFNVEAFNRAETFYRKLGYEVENPADQVANGDVRESWQYYMKRAITRMLTCDIVVMLEGWKLSPGASLEYSLASNLGMTIHFYQE